MMLNYSVFWVEIKSNISMYRIFAAYSLVQLLIVPFQVDPRWPEELVPGRRVADSCAENEAPGPEETQARFVFCSRVPKPQIIYAYAEKDGSDPRDAALVSVRMTDFLRARSHGVVEVVIY